MLVNRSTPDLFHFFGIRRVAAGVKVARLVILRDLQHPPWDVLELCARPGHSLQGAIMLAELIQCHHLVLCIVI